MYTKISKQRQKCKKKMTIDWNTTGDQLKWES